MSKPRGRRLDPVMFLFDQRRQKMLAAQSSTSTAARKDPPTPKASPAPSSGDSVAAASLFQGMYQPEVEVGVKGGHGDRADTRIDGMGEHAERTRPTGADAAMPGQRYAGTATGGDGPVSASQDGTDFTDAEPSKIEQLADPHTRLDAGLQDHAAPGQTDPFSHLGTPTTMSGRNPTDKQSQQSSSAEAGDVPLETGGTQAPAQAPTREHNDNGATRSRTFVDEPNFRPIADSWDKNGATGVLTNLYSRLSYYTMDRERFNSSTHRAAHGPRGKPAPDSAGGDGAPTPAAVDEVAPKRTDRKTAWLNRRRQIAGPDVSAHEDIRPIDAHYAADLATKRITDGRINPAPDGGAGNPTGPMGGKRVGPSGIEGGPSLPGTGPTAPSGGLGSPTPDNPIYDDGTDVATTADDDPLRKG